MLDLSSLWAGPLCADLLGACGARVIKVESTARPDGLRHGPAPFFDLLNGRKSSLALPLHTEQGRRQLAELIAQADVVVEASRPRALAQLGVDAARMVRQHPGLAWISITGHGRDGEAANWVAFGDDASVAGGLSWLLGDARNDPVFCADAIADPLAGLHAAVLAWGALLAGGGIYALALKDVVAHCALFNPPADGAWHERGSRWQRELVVTGVTVAQPRARMPSRVARARGSDTESVLAELGVRC